MGRQARFASSTNSKLFGRSNSSSQGLLPSETANSTSPDTTRPREEAGAEAEAEDDGKIRTGGRPSSRLAHSLRDLFTLCWGGRSDEASLHGEPRRRQRRSGSLRRGGRSSAFNVGKSVGGQNGDEEDRALLLEVEDEKQQQDEYDYHSGPGQHHVARASPLSELTMVARKRLQRSYHMV